MKTKNKYTVIVGNVGTMDYTSKKLAEECYTTYVSLSKVNETRAAVESVTMMKNDEIVKEYIGAIEENNQ